MLAYDEFTQGYIEALFFTDTEPGLFAAEWDEHRESIDGSIPRDVGMEKFHPPSLREILDDCARFQVENQELLDKAINRPGYSLQAAGNDFWFTRNHHGVGFRDREQLPGDVANKLTDAAHEYPERYVTYGNAVDLPGQFIFVG